MVVVSPLTALMIDQKQKFVPWGINVEFVPWGINVEFVGQCQSNETAVVSVIQREVQLVHINPESLLCNKSYRTMLQNARYQEQLVAFVVDKVHCFKLW